MEHGVNKMNNEILKKIVESQNWNNTNLPDYLSKEHIQNLLYNIIETFARTDTQKFVKMI